jgi:Zn-dependent alcohol dehydrogenase
VELAEKGELHLDSMVSRRFSLNEVNDAFKATAAGELLRGVLV